MVRLYNYLTSALGRGSLVGLTCSMYVLCVYDTAAESAYARVFSALVLLLRDLHWASFTSYDGVDRQQDAVAS